MIASLRGLIVAGVIALVLAIVVGIDLRRDRPDADRSIVPGFAADTIAAFTWSERDIKIVRDSRSSTGWRWTKPPGEADARAVDDVIAALRGARWHRSAEPSAAGAPTATLEIQRIGMPELGIVIGQPLAGAEQHWIVTGEHARLVDAWVVRALVPEPVALRVRDPLAGAALATELAVNPGVTLRGRPRRMLAYDGVPIELLVAPQYVETLERALAELAVVALPAAAPAGRVETRIQIDGNSLVAMAGACPGTPNRIAIDGARAGRGCVEDAQWRAIVAADRAFALPPAGPARERELARLVDKRPAGIDPVRVTLADGAVLDLEKRPRIAGTDVDPARVVELLAVLATPVEWAPLPAAKPTSHIEIAAKDVTITLDLYPGGIVGRRGEPIALRVGAGSHAILARGGRAYRDPELWAEEPTTIRTLSIGSTRFVRGAVVGEWTGPGKVDGALVEQLVTLLARPRSLGDATPPANPRAVEIDITPPGGASSKRSLALGRTRAGCTATVDGRHELLDPQICALADRVAR